MGVSREEKRQGKVSKRENASVLENENHRRRGSSEGDFGQALESDRKCDIHSTEEAGNLWYRLKDNKQFRKKYILTIAYIASFLTLVISEMSDNISCIVGTVPFGCTSCFCRTGRRDSHFSLLALCVVYANGSFSTLYMAFFLKTDGTPTFNMTHFQLDIFYSL
jgi:hypothetical protein